MEKFDFNVQITDTCGDIYDHLNAVEWVDKQMDYASNEAFVSGRGLVPLLNNLPGNLVGCEIGVCHGTTTHYLAKNVPNLYKLHAIDPYPSFIDWNGTRVTRERQDEIKRRCFEKLIPYQEKINFVYDTSANFAQTLEDNSLDFVFIDGEHSYEATLKDCQLYWSKVKLGGIFAGHDINLRSVHDALNKFLSELGKNMNDVICIENSAWYLIRD